MRAYADYADADGNLIIAKNQMFDEATLLAVEAAYGLDEFERIQAGEIIAVLHDVEPGWWSRSELTNINEWVKFRKRQKVADGWLEVYKKIVARNQ